MSALLRFLAAAFFVAPAAAGVASCVSLYDLDDFSAAVNELCGVVAECDDSFYPACVAEANARLTTASPEERAAFLVAFTDTGCLETCAAAKSCFDLVPLCAPAASSCDVKAQCCGFYKAGSRCDTGDCCLPNGVACDLDGDCCTGSCTELAGGKTCGGIVCAQLDEPCTEMACCGDEEATGELRCSFASKTCVRCEDDGMPCTSGADCCSDYCDNAQTGEPTGICGNPTCGLLPGQVCTSDDECCGFCVPVAREGYSICNDEPCLPNDVSCDDYTQCCSLECSLDGLCIPPNVGCTRGIRESCMTNAECCEGTCHPAQSHCCKLDGVACAGDFECCDPMACVVDGVTGIGTCQSDMGCGIPDLEGPCGSDSDCCSQDCNKELDHCCLTVDNGCGHGVCFQGEPLDVTCDDGSSDGGNRGMLPVSKPFGDPGCIDDICGDRNFAYCCCDGWDAGCVDRALSSDVCNLTCLEDPNPPMP